MTDIMSLGLTSVRAYTQGLATISDNVANAQTPGYARRSVRIEDATVIRYSDEWRNNEARIASGLASQASTRLEWLDAAERSLDDSATGVGQLVGAVFNRAQELAADPNSTARRSAYLQSVDDAASAFRTTAEGLQDAANGIVGQAQQSVKTINTDLKGLLNVNQTLLATPQGTSGYASLLDQRDRLLSEVSQAMPVDISLDFNGVATVRVSGSGETLVNADTASQVGVSAATNGTLSFSVTAPDGSQSAFTPQGGTLAGLSSAATDIADKRSEVDALAAKFVDLINSTQAAGRKADGTAGGPLLALGAQGALTLSALDVSVDDIAAGDASSQNGNLLALDNARKSSGVESSWTALVADHAQKLSSAKLVKESTQSRSAAADEARDGLSGVDLDREAIELTRLQQSYQAAAQVIQVAREMMQSIMQIGG
jgi:flagellar hook-associated protein 1 FlgK